MTEIVLLPVAYTKGIDFKRAPRHPARSITYFDRFGTTAGAGPSDECASTTAPAPSPRSTSPRRPPRCGR